MNNNTNKDGTPEKSGNPSASPITKRDEEDIENIFIYSDSEKPISTQSYADTDEYELKMIRLAKARRTQTPQRPAIRQSQQNQSQNPAVQNSGASVQGQSRMFGTGTRPQGTQSPYQTSQIRSAVSVSPQPHTSANNASSAAKAIPIPHGTPSVKVNAVHAERRSMPNQSDGRRTMPHGRIAVKAKKENGFNGSALSSVLKAVVYIVFVLVVSCALGFFGISVGNDIFALVKSEAEIQITIPEQTTLDSLAAELKKQGVIKYPFFFRLYANLRHDSDGFVAGTYTVSPSMNYDILRNSFQKQAAEVTTLSITIPEGYTVDQIINLMVENGLGTQEKYVNAIQNYDFDYWFIKDMDPSPSRKYRLEGYLYPDTYYFFSNATEIQVLYKLLDRFEEIFPDAYREECAESGWTVDRLVTLASMIQMEAKYESEYGYISSVFHNRLNYPYYETQGYLQSDATTQYALGLDRTTDLYGVNNEIESPYNTYKNKGLPPGPITNPSFSAITWALYPTDTDYFYFVAKPDGYSLFATNSTDHAHNIIEARGIG